MAHFQEDCNNEATLMRTNLVEFEKYFRQMKNELLIKRSEVIKLKTELEQANEDTHKVRVSFDKLKNNFEDNKITMDLFLKKSQDFEPKYYEKRDALIKAELQYKLAASEIEVLKEDLQKVTVEKAQLLRKLDMLEEKQKRDVVYHGDISEKLIEIKNTLATIQNEVQKTKEDHTQLTLLSQKLDLSEEALNKCKKLAEMNNRMKKQIETLEEQNIFLKAKCDKFEALLEKTSLKDEFDLPAKIFLSQCKKMSNFYNDALENGNDLLTKANELLVNEKIANVKLIEDNEKLYEKCKLLQVKMDEIYINTCDSNTIELKK